MTILNSVTSDLVTVKPFPHLVIENVLDSELCHQLIEEFPPLHVVTRNRQMGENVKAYYPARLACADDHVAEVWKTFLSDHLTPEFYAQVIEVFRPFLLQEYPDIEQIYGKKLESFSTGIDGRDSFDQYDILLNALIGVHTAVSGEPRLERQPHVKNCDKFLEGFLYLRPDDDEATGGDYELFSVRGNSRPKFGKWAQTDRQKLQLERTLAYGKNTLVLVLNTSRSIQALTPRGPGKRPLMYCNFTVRTPRMLFDLDYTAFGRTHRFLRRYADKIFR